MIYLMRKFRVILFHNTSNGGRIYY